MARSQAAAARVSDLREPQVTGPAPIRRVRLGSRAAAVIESEARRSRDGNETGGILLGRIDGDVAAVCDAGGPGPRAVRKPRFFLRDLEHAQRLADLAYQRDGSIWIGEWHTHTAGEPAPSSLDLHTYTQLFGDPELRFEVLVSVILTADNGWHEPVAWACYPDRAETVPLVVDIRADTASTPATEGTS